jgi:hypothetical protein
MAITRYAGDRFYGLDAEKNTLLSQVLDGAIYKASDTLFEYLKIGGYWVLSGGSGGTGGIGSSGSQGGTGVPIFVQSTSTIASNYTIQSTDSQMSYGVYEAGNTAGIMYFTLQNTTSIPTGTTFTVFRTVTGSTQFVQIQGTSSVTVQSAGATPSQPKISATLKVVELVIILWDKILGGMVVVFTLNLLIHILVNL